MNARFEARPDPKDRRPGKYLTDTGIDFDAVLCQVGFNQAGKTIKAGDKEAITKAIKENEAFSELLSVADIHRGNVVHHSKSAKKQKKISALVEKS